MSEMQDFLVRSKKRVLYLKEKSLAAGRLQEKKRKWERKLKEKKPIKKTDLERNVGTYWQNKKEGNEMGTSEWYNGGKKKKTGLERMMGGEEGSARSGWDEFEEAERVGNLKSD